MSFEMFLMNSQMLVNKIGRDVWVEWEVEGKGVEG